ncbi:hypothetical protein BH11PSE12_BH11PSE12_07750 [soil metagenome]
MLSRAAQNQTKAVSSCRLIISISPLAGECPEDLAIFCSYVYLGIYITRFSHLLNASAYPGVNRNILTITRISSLLPHVPVVDCLYLAKHEAARPPCGICSDSGDFHQPTSLVSSTPVQLMLDRPGGRGWLLDFSFANQTHFVFRLIALVVIWWSHEFQKNAL